MAESAAMIHDLNNARLAKTAGPEAAASALDAIEDVSDYSKQTLEHLKRRIEDSVGVEQFVYREVELDVVWRLIDCAIADAKRRHESLESIIELESLRKTVMDTHDLLGNGVAASQAASRLAMALV